MKNIKNIEEQLNFGLENQKILSLNKILKLKLFESFLPYTKDSKKNIHFFILNCFIKQKRINV